MAERRTPFETRPLARLLAAYASEKDRIRHDVIHAFDVRLADIVRTTREPLIGQMRLTWWHDVLTDAAGGKGRGEPVVDALRADVLPVQGNDDLLAMIDGWERLLEPMPLGDDDLLGYARDRGGRLFLALAGDRTKDKRPDWLSDAGAGWALWDLSGHVNCTVTAHRAVDLSKALLARIPVAGWPKSLAPLRIAVGLARHDVTRDRIAASSLTVTQYVRIMRLGLLGR